MLLDAFVFVFHYKNFVFVIFISFFHFFFFYFQLSVELHALPFSQRAQNLNIETYNFREFNVLNRQKYL